MSDGLASCALGKVPPLAGEELANRILLAFPAEVLKQLLPHLKPLVLHQGQVINRHRDPIREIMFVNRGMISVVKTMRDGRSVEIASRGIEGVATPESFLGLGKALFDLIVQIPGLAFSIDRRVLKAITDKSEISNLLFQQYIHVVADEHGQAAACNRLHSIEQRCRRWLLSAHDNARADTFPLTQELLAAMLGVQRPGVSIEMRTLEKIGFVRHTREYITIVDRTGLETSACECYGMIKAEFDHCFRLSKDLNRHV